MDIEHWTLSVNLAYYLDKQSEKTLNSEQTHFKRWAAALADLSQKAFLGNRNV